MRITNKVMQNNALSNINRNKTLQDTLNTELATGKKVDRPSDDPVVAIRALRLRSDVSQISQYSTKNVPDANQWLDLTESAVKTTVSVVKDMIEKCEKGSSDTLTTSDRKVIIDSLKELREEVYSTGNADYAGRYIFTGYRTDTSLTFTENTTKKLTISEMFRADDAEKMTYISTKDGDKKLTDISESSYDGANAMEEQQITSISYYRFRLSYDGIDNGSSATGFLDKESLALKSLVQLKDAAGNTVSPDVAFETDKDKAYKDIADATGKLIIIPSTGEVLMSQDVYEAMKAKDGVFNISYDKTNWTKGDLRPEHYFPVVEEDTSVTPAKQIKYNWDVDQNGVPVNSFWDYLNNGIVDQPIEYQVGFAQNMRVNTVANEVYRHDAGRDVDELIELSNYLTDVENTKSKLEAMLDEKEKYDPAQLETIQKDYDAADKAVTLLKDQLQKMFSKKITAFQKYLDTIDNAVTSIGNRSSRLELISNRLDDQTTTLKTLQSENEDADATEVAVQLSSAQVSYQAALMATSDMIKETLLNYL